MGFKPSPFFAVRLYYWAEAFARGHHKDHSSFLQWDEINFNLPVDPAYDPSKPQVMKWDEKLAKDFR
jgi:hypothetical protein